MFELGAPESRSALTRLPPTLTRNARVGHPRSKWRRLFRSRSNRPGQNVNRPHGQFFAPFLAAMSRDINREFETAPYPEFVEGVAQVVLHYLFSGAYGLRNLAVGLAFPDQGRDLHFRYSEPLTGLHDFAPSQTWR